METEPAMAEAAIGTAPEGTLRVEQRLTWLDFSFALGLAAFTAALRADVPAPSLWLDDAWVALVTKAHGVGDVLVVGGTSPGFAFLLKVWLTVVGFTELKAQFLPLFFGVATPPFLYSLLASRGIHRFAAAAGAFLLATSGIHITYSDRVKQFTLDGFASVVVVAVFWWLLADVRSSRRWRAATSAAVAALLLSSPSIVLVGAGFGVAWGKLLLKHRAGYRVALVPTTLVAVVALVWSLLVLAPAVNPALRNYWKDYYVTVDEDPLRAFENIGLALKLLIERAVALPAAVAVALVLASVLVVLVRRQALGLLLVLPFVIAVALAVADFAPLGTGRTDIYLYPPLAILVALALNEVAAFSGPAPTGLWRLVPAGVFAVIAGLWAMGHPTPRSYPRENIAPLVARVERTAMASDAILVYPAANFAFGLYTTWPVEISPTELGIGFEVRVQRPNLFVLEIDRRRPETFAAAVRRVALPYRRVWFIVTHASRPIIFAFEDAFTASGYSREQLFRSSGARLILWVKE
jgi:hypothetical protein